MAVSDIHVGHNGNKPMTEELFPDSPDDWLILAGDVSEKTDDIRWALKLLRSDSQRSSGFRATTNCGRPPRIRFRFTERRGTSTWSTCAANSTSSRPRTRSRCGRESRARSRSSRCSFSTTTPSCRKRARQGTRARDRAGQERRRHRRVPALAAAVCNARRVVPGENRIHPGTVGRAP